MSTSRDTETLVIGTRGSLLARTQSQWVIDRLREAHPDLAVSMEIITTTGDRNRRQSLPEIGGKGLFTQELEDSLRAGGIDLAVHSAKDLPTEPAAGLEILAYPVREDARDAWVAGEGIGFADLSAGSLVGTSSLRRQAQLARLRSDLRFASIRGNVETRIRKVRQGDYAGTVMAMAGLKRSGLTEHATHPFDLDSVLPPAGQGALALQGRCDDERVRGIVSAINDEATFLAVVCERAVLARLEAGCHAPVAIYAVVEGDRLSCRARVCDPTGRACVEASADGPGEAGADVADRLVEQLESAGARTIIDASPPRIE